MESASLARLRDLLAKDFAIDPARLVPAATLADLEIDSLRMIEIAFSVEDAFGITVSAEPAELMARVKTLGDLAAYVDGEVAARGTAQAEAAG
jgi:acyl carrier protein